MFEKGEKPKKEPEAGESGKLRVSLCFWLLLLYFCLYLQCLLVVVGIVVKSSIEIVLELVVESENENKCRTQKVKTVVSFSILLLLLLLRPQNYKQSLGDIKKVSLCVHSGMTLPFDTSQRTRLIIFSTLRKRYGTVHIFSFFKTTFLLIILKKLKKRVTDR